MRLTRRDVLILNNIRRSCRDDMNGEASAAMITTEAGFLWQAWFCWNRPMWRLRYARERLKVLKDAGYIAEIIHEKKRESDFFREVFVMTRAGMVALREAEATPSPLKLFGWLRSDFI